MRLQPGVAAVVLVAAVLAAVAVASAQRPEPAVRGVDEVFYTDLRGFPVQPGAAWTQRVPVQDPGLSWLRIPYRLDLGRPGLLRVTVAAPDGRVLADGSHELAPTPGIDSLETWLQATFWGPVARYLELPVPATSGAPYVDVTVTVPSGSRPVSLWWSYVDPETGLAAKFPAGVDVTTTPARRLAVETGYGEVRPALAQAPLMESRVARLAPPWLPQPAPWLLLALTIAGGVALAAWCAAGAAPAPAAVSRGPAAPRSP